MGQSASTILTNQIIQLRLTSKQLNRQSEKSKKAEAEQKAKLKAAIEKGNLEAAKVYAQNAIREKNMSVQYLKLASRIEAVTQRVQTAQAMGQLTKSMGKVVNGMDKVLDTMDVNKISKMMDKFEGQFEDLDVRSAYMEKAMDTTTAGATPEDEVNNLIQFVADENGLKVSEEFGMASTKPIASTATATAAPTDLEARFAALHGGGN